MKRAYGRIGIITMLLFASCLVLTSLKLHRVTDMYGDSAMFFQTTQNIARTGAPVSRVYQRMFFYHLHHFARYSAGQFAKDSLIEPERNDNVLRSHTYLVLFPLALIARFAPVEAVLISAFVLAFVGLLALASLYLKRHDVPPAWNALFIFAVILCPAWAVPILAGQFYPDRIFVFAGAALLFVAASRRLGRVPLLLAALLCLSVNERGALVGGTALMLYASLYWKSATDRGFKLLVGFLMLVFGVAVLKFVITSGMYGLYVSSSLQGLVSGITTSASLWETAVFIAANAVLLVFALFEWRSALIAFVVMVPQLVGAELITGKLEWVSHYSSFYFPILVWAAARGFVQLRALVKKRELNRFVLPGAAAAIVYALTLNPSTVPLDFSISHIGQSFVPQLVAELTGAFGQDAQKERTIADSMRRLIPPNATVTAPESAIPFLWRHHDVHKFPGGLTHTDYAIVYVDSVTARPVQYDAFGFGPRGARVTALLMERLRKAGFDVDHPAFVPALSVAVIGRVNKPATPVSESTP